MAAPAKFRPRPDRLEVAHLRRQRQWTITRIRNRREGDVLLRGSRRAVSAFLRRHEGGRWCYNANCLALLKPVELGRYCTVCIDTPEAIPPWQ